MDVVFFLFYAMTVLFILAGLMMWIGWNNTKWMWTLSCARCGRPTRETGDYRYEVAFCDDCVGRARAMIEPSKARAAREHGVYLKEDDFVPPPYDLDPGEP